MRRLILVVLICFSCFGQEIKKPSVYKIVTWSIIETIGVGMITYGFVVKPSYKSWALVTAGTVQVGFSIGFFSE
jgi:hypothetical protein